MSSVLIVEDSPTQAQQLQLILESNGFAARIARDGREALALVKKEAFDLVLTDIVMPRLSGFELCRKIKNDPKHKTLPVIILTTLTDPLDMVQALECGADNYITKPYNEEFLIHRINAIIRNSHVDQDAKFQMGVEIQFLDKTFNITSEKKQILNLLISTFEDIVRTNQDLKKSQEELRSANAQVEHYAHMLEAQMLQEREQALQALQEREHQLSSIYNTVSDIIFQLEVEKDGRYRFASVNDAFAASTGLNVNLVVGQRVEDVIPKASQALVFSKYAEAIRDKKIVHWEETSDYPTGRLIGEVSIAPVFDESGKCTHLVGAVHDITARKRAEEHLRESEERYRNLVEGSPQGIMTVQRGRIVYCNPATARMFGYDAPSELIGTEAINVVHPEDRHEALQTGNAQMRAGAPQLYRSYRGLRKDGSIMWYEPQRGDTRWQGHRAVQWLLNDITESRQLRQQLESAQRMEAIGRLAGGIAHDFNNMLAVMSSYGELAIDQLEDNHPARKDVKVMLDATGRAAGLTRQLLAFSRRQVLELKMLDVNKIVANMEKMLLRVIGEDVKLRTNLGSDLGSIRADESQIEQIIMNLAVNARDAMPTGGTLTIETARKHLDEHYVKSHLDVEPGNYVMLAMTDTGSGMDEETQRRIFEPFFTTKPMGKGTGLGLSTVYGIVMQMGGLVYVYSELGKGTSLKVYFPLLETPAQEEARVVHDSTPLRGEETILLVEDDEHVREATRRILASGGYQVLPAENGLQAVELAKELQGRIHLLISDVVMPSMSGREVLEHVRQYGVTHVLFMSGYTDDSVINHGILDGDFPFLHKPFSKDSMLKKVREVLRSPSTIGSDTNAQADK
jgi:PAS domain S-box-containing protein